MARHTVVMYAACAGPMVWYPLDRARGEREPVALVECACGEIFATTVLFPPEHRETPIFVAAR